MAVLAVDAGGTRIKIAVVENASVLARATLDAQSGMGLKERLPAITATLHELVPAGLTIDGLGMAFPSLTEGDRVIGGVGKFVDAETLDLAAWTRKEFGVPFAIDNDARLATVGEWVAGVGRGANDLVMVTLGTGIGTGVILDGRVLRGLHGAAGILGGHMTANIGGRACACGNIGCWETEASTAALPEMAEQQIAFEKSILRSGDLDYAAVFAAAAAGDECATRLRARSLQVWGALAVSLVHAYDPELLIFGGGVLGSGEAVLGSIRRAVDCHAWPQVRIEVSALGDDAAVIGCEWLLKSRTEQRG